MDNNSISNNSSIASVKKELRAHLTGKHQSDYVSGKDPILLSEVKSSSNNGSDETDIDETCETYNEILCKLTVIRNSFTEVDVSEFDEPPKIFTKILSQVDDVERLMEALLKSCQEKICSLESAISKKDDLISHLDCQLFSSGQSSTATASTKAKSSQCRKTESSDSKSFTSSNTSSSTTSEHPLNLSKSLPFVGSNQFMFPVPSPDVIGHLQQLYGKDRVKALLQSANLPAEFISDNGATTMDLLPSSNSDSIILDENSNATSSKTSNQNRNPWLPSKVDTTPVLDTSIVASTVRNLLSSHNIGQRLFAKHILGLSQGTVSELLSKPKPWEKLTEKGRESYRKMSTWAADIENVLSLKSLSPKKGYTGSTSQTFTTPIQSNSESSETERKIARILQQAKEAMGEQSTDSKPRTPDLSSETIQEIYQRQLAGLAVASMPGTSKKDGSESSKTSKPQRSDSIDLTVESDHISSVKHLIESTSDEANISKGIVRRIYYEQLVKRLQSSESTGDLEKVPQLRKEIQELETSFPELKETKRLNASISQKSSSKKCTAVSSRTASPKIQHLDNAPLNLSLNMPSLQQQEIAANIANNFGLSLGLLATNPFNILSTSSTGLPNNNITLDLSNTPKSSIKSTVSSSLSKSMMPPITSEQFERYGTLATDEIVQQIKDVLGRHTISQRLFGEQVLGLSQGSVSDLLARPKPWTMLTQKGREPFIRMKVFLDDPLAIKRLTHHVKDTNSRADSTEQPSRPSSANSVSSTASLLNLYISDSKIYTLAKNIPFNIDTTVICSTISQILERHDLNHRVFAENVLGISIASLQDMLYRPQPWSQLSSKAREPYLRMNLWLADTDNAIKLKQLQNDQKCRRRSVADTSDDNLNGRPSAKKSRYMFTDEQREILSHAFIEDQYPSSETMESIAAQFSLPFKSIANWFHNQRTRQRAHLNPTNAAAAMEPQLQDESSEPSPSNQSDEHSSTLLIDAATEDRPISKRKASKPIRLLLNKQTTVAATTNSI